MPSGSAASCAPAASRSGSVTSRPTTEAAPARASARVAMPCPQATSSTRRRVTSPASPSIVRVARPCGVRPDRTTPSYQSAMSAQPGSSMGRLLSWRPPTPLGSNPVTTDTSGQQQTIDEHKRRGVPWWREAVTYQLYIRSFADGNGEGLGAPAGIRRRLPYIASLGVDAIWITPWSPPPQADGGYDVADYGEIPPPFGTLDEAEALIREV